MIAEVVGVGCLTVDRRRKRGLSKFVVEEIVLAVQRMMCSIVW